MNIKKVMILNLFYIIRFNMTDKRRNKKEQSYNSLFFGKDGGSSSSSRLSKVQDELPVGASKK